MSIREKSVAPDIDDVIRQCIEQIFNQYDDDGSGSLNKDECFNFFMNSVDEYSQSPSLSQIDKHRSQETYLQKM